MPSLVPGVREREKTVTKSWMVKVGAVAFSSTSEIEFNSLALGALEEVERCETFEEDVEEDRSW